MSFKLFTLDTWTTCKFIWKSLKSKHFLLDTQICPVRDIKNRIHQSSNLKCCKMPLEYKNKA